jgi:hypothetical protein
LQRDSQDGEEKAPAMIGRFGNPRTDLVVGFVASSYAQVLRGPLAKVRPVKLR